MKGFTKGGKFRPTGRSNFTIKDYEKNEDRNHHTENATALVKKYGTVSEINKIKEIKTNHEQRGHILKEEQDERDNIVRKYHRRLLNENEDLK